MPNFQKSSLLSLSPLDGRYKVKCEELNLFFSEFGLIKYRLAVEISWLRSLCESAGVSELANVEKKNLSKLDSLVESFQLKDAERIKEIEQTTNHDVKAVEYFIKENLEREQELKPLLEFIHFACTSEDINNLAYALIFF